MSKFFLLLALISPSVFAGQLTVSVLDNEGDKVEFAVVMISSTNTLQPNPPADLNMKQINEQFEPYVLAVPTGAQVKFPNYDDIKHHVYSFSETKTFELELYDEFTGSPVTFEKPGIVELGCNIHDWMLAYIYVTDAPYFAVTGSKGQSSFELPDGDYTVSIWHPNMDAKDIDKRQKVSVGGNTALTWNFDHPLSQRLDFSSGFSDY